MIDKRLLWFIKYNNLITNSQCSFRNQRSTVDHMVRLETFMKEAIIQKQYLIAIFFQPGEGIQDHLEI